MNLTGFRPLKTILFYPDILQKKATTRVEHSIFRDIEVKRNIDNKTNSTQINNLWYANDAVLMVETLEDLQMLLNAVVESRRIWALINKTKFIV